MSHPTHTSMENTQDESKAELLSLFESELKASDNRYLKLRSELLQTLTSNAQLLEYVQYLEDQLKFYKQKSEFNSKKHEILSNASKINNINISPSKSNINSPSLSPVPSTRGSIIDINDDDEIDIDPEMQPNGNIEQIDSRNLSMDNLCSPNASAKL